MAADYGQQDAKGILGYITEPTRNETKTVTTASQSIAEQRLNLNPRKMMMVRNVSSSATCVLWVTQGGIPAVVGVGIQLKQGESFVDATDAGYQCWQGPVQAISNEAAASNNIIIVER